VIGIDTNVLVRYLTRDDEQQSEIALDYLTHRCTPDQPGYINRIVQCELVWVLGRAYQYSREQISGALEMIFRTRQFLIEDQETALAALRAYRQGKADYADAFIGFANKAAGCDSTVTFDRSAARLGVFEHLQTNPSK